ncbi:MAG: gluconate 2-dehydrogenase subunit 3 family protein [Chitinophagaceae bacterium]
MDRRKSIKALAVGTLSAGVMLEACKSPDKKAEEQKQTGEQKPAIDRQPQEAALEKALNEQQFFNEHEMATIAVLSDIIIPKDDVSGSATDAKVPDFIEFIVKDMPQHQVPMRGGLRWLDVQCMKRYEKAFKDCSDSQKIEMVDAIAYPAKAKPEMKQGVAFFNLMRNLTATGFYTSQIGIKDIGYAGNKPNEWKGVPDDVLKQYGLAYSERELRECI